MNYREKMRLICIGAAMGSGLMLNAKPVVLSESASKQSKILPPGNTPLVSYVIPPLSSIKRLPEHIPDDGKLNGELRIIAAKGEFEPASFMIFARRNINDLRLEVSSLHGPAGTIAQSNLDLRVVKCWYQAGTAWSSYFADPSKKELVPELLLHDEKLIKVDYNTRDNYLRVDYPGKSEYRWISYSTKNDPGYFSHDNMPVSDAKELQPIRLTAGRGKQFWLTVKVPENAAPGSYSGKISLFADNKKAGEIQVKLRVLPFTLPAPGTYYDFKNKFYVSLYNHCDLSERLSLNGNDLEMAKRKLAAEYVNMHEHGCDYPLVSTWKNGVDREVMVNGLKLIKESPLKKDTIFGGIKITDWYVMVQNKGECKADVWNRYTKQVDADLKIFRSIFPETLLYCIGWDEPSVAIIKGQRRGWKYAHEKGLKIIETCKDKHLPVSGYNEDFSNYGGNVSPEAVRKWHAMGGRVSNYAMPHTGPENPDLIRRTHGMIPYKKDLDGTCNYTYYEAANNIWDDFSTDTFRCFNLVYPTREAVIDTLAWEGFREGVDDIRYATKLLQLASQAVKSKNIDTVYTARKALQWLALMDEENIDLNTMRLEMINYIMKINSALTGEKK